MPAKIMSPYEIREAMEAYVQLKKPELFDDAKDYYPVCDREEIFIRHSGDYRFIIDHYKFFCDVRLVFLCTPETEDLQMWGAANLTIVDLRKDKSKRLPLNIRYYFYGFSVSGYYCPYRVHIISDEGIQSFRNDYCVVQIEQALDLIEKHKLETNESSLQFKYEGSVYQFARHTFAAGVELEVPMYYDSDEAPKELKKHWLFTTDSSQIKGDLEVASKPTSLAYITSSRFGDRIQKLYKALDVPKHHKLYSSSSEGNKGSGIHVHISWHKLDATFVEAAKVRNHYYRLCEAKGGKSFLLDVGGKSATQFDYYSPWRPQLGGSDKYDCVYCVSENHVELRWLANSPNPAVVHQRIMLAVDIFREAVLQSIREQIESTSKIILCRTLPQTLLKKPLAQQQPTAPALAQALQSLDLPALAPHS